MFSVLTLALVGLPLGFVLLRRFEAATTFHPERAPARGTWDAPAGAEDVWFVTADGVRLHGWFFRAAGTSRPAEAAGRSEAGGESESRNGPAGAGAAEGHGGAGRATILYFHGNGGNISYAAWLGADLGRRGADVLLFDYRGYGRSDGQVEGERGLYADAEAAYSYVVGEMRVDPRRLVLYGQSLGTAAAADVASRRPCGALVLESGLSSASDMAAAILPWLPRTAHRLAKYRFDTVSKLPRVNCPVFVAHGDRDEIIPVEQGRKLYDAAPEPKRLHVVAGAGHNDLVVVGGAVYLDALEGFVAESVGGGR
ncbi:MAG TPA: alpha/beta hydrolase [Pyrinomonadaceae bacterium]|nr:alpha/beta hydrolase [Pyrinomonadaceae bacterium]